jgi:methylaspartate mutase sigma subunit
VSTPDPVEYRRAAPTPARRGAPVVVSSVSSDSHTWNLVFLQLLIEELGFEVVNLGACVPDELLVSECLSIRPGMVVISRELARIPMVIGGKLGTSGGQTTQQVEDLLAAGFDAVFDDRADGPASFRRFIASISDGRVVGLEQ